MTNNNHKSDDVGRDAPMGEIAYDPTDPSVRDTDLASAADREWASLHGHRPGVWRVRRCIGAEGPPRQIQHLFDQMPVVLVVVVAPGARIRQSCPSKEQARFVALNDFNLLRGDER